MRYLGGKSKIRKPLGAYLQSRLEGRVFVEPFCGALNITAEIKGSRIATDANPHLITLHKAVQSGWMPPDNLSEKQWQDLKEIQNPQDPITAFAGFGASFGGMWFHTYAKDATGRNYPREAAKSLLKKHSFCQDVLFYQCSYEKLTFGEGALIYCDPPYRGTYGYKGTDPFQHDRFYEWCLASAKRGALVLVSEYTAPSDWGVVWEQEVSVTVSRSKTGLRKFERLFEVPRG